MTGALAWFKSTYSSNAGGDCVEVAYNWRKSSYSGDQAYACVEVAAHPTAIHVRDSKVPAGPSRRDPRRLGGVRTRDRRSTV